MAEFMAETHRCAVWAEMGLGKTFATLIAIERLYCLFEIESVLIIGPPDVVNQVWPAEVRKWSDLLPALPRMETLSCFQMAKLQRPYDLIVIDEAQKFKSQKSGRYRQLRNYLNRFPGTRLIELTGTPAGNGLLDLWAQVSLLDDGYRLGHPFSYFRERFFESDFMGYNWTLKAGSKEAIYDAVEDICRSLQTVDYLSMPDKVVIPYPVKLSGLAMDKYRKLMRDFMLEISDTKYIEAVNAAVLTTKLHQFTGGQVYDNDGKPYRYHGQRLDALKNLIEVNVGQPVIVTYAYEYQKEELLTLEGATLASADNVDAWNAGKIPILIVHPSITGLNLQEGGHIMIWYGLTWSLEQYEQTVARLWRQGQTRPVMIYQMYAMNTIDEIIWEAIRNKHLTQQDLLERVKMAYHKLVNKK